MKIYPPNIPLGTPGFPGKGELFVGTCYQPIDRTADQIKTDIEIMRKAGFNVVRMGDLSWDSFEPQNNNFSFELCKLLFLW